MDGTDAGFYGELFAIVFIQKRDVHSGVYFAIFSSIQLSIILAGYCSWIIIKKGIGQILETHKFSFAWIVKEMWLYFVIEILWFISLLFESQGRRAGMLNSDTFSLTRLLYRH